MDVGTGHISAVCVVCLLLTVGVEGKRERM